MAKPASQQLTLKQQKFVKHYIATGNGSEAARRAGYSKRRAKETASELVTKRNIKDKIEKVMEKQAKEIDITAEMVLNELLALLNETKDESSKMCNGNTRIKAIELLGKHLGMFTPKQELDIKYQKHEDWVEMMLRKEQFDGAI